MKGFFILSAIALLASCRKTNPVTNTPTEMMETNAAKTLIPGGPVSSGKFKLSFTSLSPAPSALPNRDSIPIGSAELQFTLWCTTYQFTDSITAKEFVQTASNDFEYQVNDSMTAKEFVQNGLDQIDIVIYIPKDAHYG